MYEPISKAQLFSNVPLDITNDNQLWFDSKQEQTNYFASLSPKLLDISSVDFIEENWVFYVPANKKDLLNANYMRFMNDDNRWYYCFITELVYVNPSTTEIRFQVDNFQTYLFDLTFYPCYVEREHVSDDSIGANITDEGLGYGDYVVDSIVDNSDTAITECNFVVQSTRPLTDPAISSLGGGMYNGIFNGLKYYAYESFEDLKSALEGFSQYTDSITSIFMAPKMLSDYDGGSHLVKEKDYAYTGSFFGKRPATINGYTPKNNKLFVYPYTCMNVINNNGGGMTLRYEFFEDDQTCEMTMTGVLNKGVMLNCYPKNYKGVVENREYQLNLAPYASCEWVNDVYSTWLTQNSGVQVASLVGGAVSIGVGAVTTNPIVAGGGLYQAISGLANLDRMSKLPDEIKGGQGGNYINTGNKSNRFELYNQTITKEYAKMIDDFFSRYGYKVNQLKLPNFHSRKSWNYVKTTEFNCTGRCPSPAISSIKEIFNRGVTLWHTSNVGNFNLDNSAI